MIIRKHMSGSRVTIPQMGTNHKQTKRKPARIKKKTKTQKEKENKQQFRENESKEKTDGFRKFWEKIDRKSKSN